MDNEKQNKFTAFEILALSFTLIVTILLSFLVEGKIKQDNTVEDITQSFHYKLTGIPDFSSYTVEEVTNILYSLHFKPVNLSSYKEVESTAAITKQEDKTLAGKLADTVNTKISEVQAEQKFQGHNNLILPPKHALILSFFMFLFIGLTAIILASVEPEIKKLEKKIEGFKFRERVLNRDVQRLLKRFVKTHNENEELKKEIQRLKNKYIGESNNEKV